MTSPLSILHDGILELLSSGKAVFHGKGSQSEIYSTAIQKFSLRDMSESDGLERSKTREAASQEADRPSCASGS